MHLHFKSVSLKIGFYSVLFKQGPNCVNEKIILISLVQKSSHSVFFEVTVLKTRGGSRAAATSKMERFVIIVNGCKPLAIITNRFILDVAAALDPPLKNIGKLGQYQYWSLFIVKLSRGRFLEKVAFDLSKQSLYDFIVFCYFSFSCIAK